MSPVAEAMENLKYFCEWGGQSWQSLIHHAISDFAGSDLHEQRVLDIGFRYGRMSCLFALLGAQVTAVETNQRCVEIARVEARKWNVEDQVEFMAYNGELDVFEDDSFDLVFTKSVLVVVPHLEHYLTQINKKLKQNGKVIFIENAQGSPLFPFVRKFKNKSWDFHRTHYFTASELKVFSRIFTLTAVKKKLIPPIYLITGYKNTDLD